MANSKKGDSSNLPTPVELVRKIKEILDDPTIQALITSELRNRTAWDKLDTLGKIEQLATLVTIMLDSSVTSTIAGDPTATSRHASDQKAGADIMAETALKTGKGILLPLLQNTRFVHYLVTKMTELNLPIRPASIRYINLNEGGHHSPIHHIEAAFNKIYPAHAGNREVLMQRVARVVNLTDPSFFPQGMAILNHSDMAFAKTVLGVLSASIPADEYEGGSPVMPMLDESTDRAGNMRLKMPDAVLHRPHVKMALLQSLHHDLKLNDPHLHLLYGALGHRPLGENKGIITIATSMDLFGQATHSIQMGADIHALMLAHKKAKGEPITISNTELQNTLFPRSDAPAAVAFINTLRPYFPAHIKEIQRDHTSVTLPASLVEHAHQFFQQFAKTAAHDSQDPEWIQNLVHATPAVTTGMMRAMELYSNSRLKDLCQNKPDLHYVFDELVQSTQADDMGERQRHVYNAIKRVNPITEVSIDETGRISKSQSAARSELEELFKIGALVKEGKIDDAQAIIDKNKKAADRAAIKAQEAAVKAAVGEAERTKGHAAAEQARRDATAQATREAEFYADPAMQKIGAIMTLLDRLNQPKSPDIYHSSTKKVDLVCGSEAEAKNITDVLMWLGHESLEKGKGFVRQSGANVEISSLAVSALNAAFAEPSERYIEAKEATISNASTATELKGKATEAFTFISDYIAILNTPPSLPEAALASLPKPGGKGRA